MIANLKQEIRQKFFGQGHPVHTVKGKNIWEAGSFLHPLKVHDDSTIHGTNHGQIAHHEYLDEEFRREHLFRDLELEQEQSLGQRAFAKNLEKILGGLLKFYNKYYNKQGQNNAQQQSNANGDKLTSTNGFKNQ